MFPGQLHSAVALPTDVTETEAPDFLLTIDGAVIGAEIAELFLPSPPDAILPLQVSENEERLVVETARRQAIQQGVPPQFLQIRLRSESLTKSNRARVAAVLCDYVAATFAAPGEVRAGIGSLPPAGLPHYEVGLETRVTSLKVRNTTRQLTQLLRE